MRSPIQSLRNKRKKIELKYLSVCVCVCWGEWGGGSVGGYLAAQ